MLDSTDLSPPYILNLVFCFMLKASSDQVVKTTLIQALNMNLPKWQLEGVLPMVKGVNALKVVSLANALGSTDNAS